MQEFTYKLMPDLPVPPKWLIDQIDFDSGLGKTSEAYRCRLTDWNGYTGFSTKNDSQDFVDEYDTWIRENITKDFQSCGLVYCRDYNGAPSTGARTDSASDYSLVYNLLTGGPDARLVFWQEEGQSLIRDCGTEIGSVANLKMIDSVLGPAGSWYLTNNRILHSIESVIDLRLSFQVKLTTSNFS